MTSIIHLFICRIKNKKCELPVTEQASDSANCCDYSCQREEAAAAGQRDVQRSSRLSGRLGAKRSSPLLERVCLHHSGHCVSIEILPRFYEDLTTRFKIYSVRSCYKILCRVSLGLITRSWMFLFLNLVADGFQWG